MVGLVGSEGRQDVTVTPRHLDERCGAREGLGFGFEPTPEIVIPSESFPDKSRDVFNLVLKGKVQVCFKCLKMNVVFLIITCSKKMR